MLLHELVTTTETVGATSSRLAKIDALATLLSRLDAAEIAPAIGFLIAKPASGARSASDGAAIAGLDAAHASEPSLTVLDVDAALERLAAASGAGSAGARRAELDGARRARDRGGVGLRVAGDPGRTAHRRARRSAPRRRRARVGAARGDGAARRDALG